MSVAMENKSSNSLHDVLCKDEWTLEDIKLFLEGDSSSVNQTNTDSKTPLHLVLRHENCSLDVVQLLLKHGANVHSKDVLGQTPLLVALLNSREDAVVMALIKNGADVRAVDNFRRTSLCVALSHRASKNVLQTLMKKGCFVNECHHRNHGGSALHCALDNYDDSPILSPDVLNMLIQRGADINAVDARGCSVLCCALQTGCKPHFIEILLEAGALLDSCLVGSPLQCVSSPSSPFRADIVELLLREGASVDQVNEEGQVPLQRALRWADYETEAIALLLDRHRSTDLNSLVDNEGNSLLHLAVHFRSKLGAVKLLVRRGVKVDTANKLGMTPLNMVVESSNCRPRLIKFLLKNGAKVRLDTINCAFEHPNVEILKLLWISSDLLNAISCVYIVTEQGPVLEWRNYSARLSCVRFLVRVYLLLTSDYSIQFFDCDHKYHQEFIDYRDRCLSELLRMKSKDVGRGYTLHGFLCMGRSSPFSSCSSPLKHAKDQVKMCNFDRLLEVISNDAFPLFFDIIAWKVGKGPMKEKLQNVRMSAAKNSTQTKEEVVLPYDIILKISQYLGKEDLLRLMLASSSVQCSEVLNKRKAEQSEELCCMFPRLSIN